MARVKYDWSHTSAIQATQANCHRGKDDEPFTPRDFDPTQPRQKPARLMVPITFLKQAFVKE